MSPDTLTTLEALAADVIRLDQHPTLWESVEAERASVAYVEACAAVGYEWMDDPEAYRYVMGTGPRGCGKATPAEFARFTLPRAIAAARSN